MYLVIYKKIWLPAASAVFLLLITGCSGFSNLKDRFIQKQPEKISATDLPFTRQSKRIPLNPLPVNRPGQVTFDTDPVLYADVSRGGKWLVYTSGGTDIPGIWLRSTDPELMTAPEKLNPNAGIISYPSF